MNTSRITKLALAMTAFAGLSFAATGCTEDLNLTVEFGAWTNTYTAGQGMVSTSTITVTPNEGYKVVEVWLSVDEHNWVPTTNDGTNNDFAAALTNPDIGESLVTAKVLVSDGEDIIEEFYYGDLTVNPVFPCDTGVAADLMVPSPDLVRNMGTERRVLNGYFGDPAGGHTVSVVVTADDLQNNDTYSSVGETTNYGWTTIATAISVSRFRVVNQPGSQPYDLEVWVDGVQVCSKTGFGTVFDY